MGHTPLHCLHLNSHPPLNSTTIYIISANCSVHLQVIISDGFPPSLLFPLSLSLSLSLFHEQEMTAQERDRSRAETRVHKPIIYTFRTAVRGRYIPSCVGGIYDHEALEGNECLSVRRLVDGILVWTTVSQKLTQLQNFTSIFFRVPSYSQGRENPAHCLRRRQMIWEQDFNNCSSFPKKDFF